MEIMSDNKIRMISVCIGMAVLLRWSLSYHSYSGHEKSPMFGDYEAQRHWQEITVNLPLDNWYKNTTNNDLQYWGLDYPPLTAYHSYFIGLIAHKINNSYVKLGESRGYESPDHKHFMRLTVLAADIFTYLPAVVLFFFKNSVNTFFKISLSDREEKSDSIFWLSQRNRVLLTALIYPGLILIDYGHFQYNCVSLGFFIISVKMIIDDHLSIASIFFVLALNYKQMELYHALPIFFYILGVCRVQKNVFKSFKIFLNVSLVVLGVFAIIWAPFFYKWPACVDVLDRLFPFDRGVFEDKVANVWCSINVLIKLKKLFSHFQLAKICLATTGLFVFPSCWDIFLKPRKEGFLLSVINVSLGFYLFSFQVHEKSILLVAVPVLLYFHEDPLFCFWFLIVSVFSMLPLLIKDQLFIAYCSIMIFYYCSVSWMWRGSAMFEGKIKFIIWSFYVSIFGMIALTIASVTLKAPEKYPDLFPLLVSVYSCAHFCLFFLYFNAKQFGLFTRNCKNKSKKM